MFVIEQKMQVVSVLEPWRGSGAAVSLPKMEVLPFTPHPTVVGFWVQGLRVSFRMGWNLLSPPYSAHNSKFKLSSESSGWKKINLFPQKLLWQEGTRMPPAHRNVHKEGILWGLLQKTLGVGLGWSGIWYELESLMLWFSQDLVHISPKSILSRK